MKKEEKDLSFDEFKEKVYKNIGTLEALDEDRVKENLRSDKKGCLGILIEPLLSPFILRVAKKAGDELKIKESVARAEEIIARPEVKKSLCAKLGVTTVLPIDVAYKITPVLYKMAQKDEIPLDSMLFAAIALKISEQGVEKYCAVEA